MSPATVPSEPLINSADPDAAKPTTGRILLFSYAFPPLRVQMTAPVVKAMAGLANLGFQIDVVCADTFSPYLGIDDSLVPYANKHFSVIQKLRPKTSLLNRLRQTHPLIASTPDLMSVLYLSAYETMMDMDLTRYDAIFTWSPFHSINLVMEAVKRHRPATKWIAQFSDPWSMNPLEKNSFSRLWSRWNEPKALKQMDLIIHSSTLSRDLMLKDQPASIRDRAFIVPHAFDSELYPARSPKHGDRLIIGHLGVLFSQRSPEPLFQALELLLHRRPDLEDRILLQLVGGVPDEMLHSDAARRLPEGMIEYIPGVSYLDSLKYMRNADLLLLIEADVRLNLFVPSKLFDYMGAGRPIIGMAPPGGSQVILDRLNADHVIPSDIDGLKRILEKNLDRLSDRREGEWINNDYRLSHDNRHIGQRLSELMGRI